MILKSCFSMKYLYVKYLYKSFRENTVKFFFFSIPVLGVHITFAEVFLRSYQAYVVVLSLKKKSKKAPSYMFV